MTGTATQRWITQRLMTQRLCTRAARPTGLRFVADTASALGARTINADAVGSRIEPHGSVFALADGVGDTEAASRAARLAATVAVRTGAEFGPAGAVLAAQRALLAEHEPGDCVLVVAVAEPAGGFRLAWVGDVRAWAWQPGQLRQLTVDHTLAEFLRGVGQPVAPAAEHLVTTSVRTVVEAEIGRAELAESCGLLLTSDGVHKPLDARQMAEVLATPVGTRQASALVEAALDAGGRDNTTALLITDSRQASRPDDELTARFAA